MTLRLLGLLALVATAAGCGAGQDPAVEGAGGSSSSSTSPPAGGGELALEVEVPEPLVSGKQVTWRLTVTNGTGDDVTLAFRSGQQGEVVLRDPDGAEAYRWSEGMMFAQALTETPLAAGAAVTFDLAGPLDVAPGTYALEAGVPSDPTPGPERSEVTVTG